MRLRCLLATAALLLPVALSAQAPAEVLLVGMYHFANPGLDVVRNEVADVLAPARQREIEQLVVGLARFKPTKVAVEQTIQDTAWLDTAYAAFRTGHHVLTRNETEQLGFRLAARQRLPRLYPIDVPGEFPFDAVLRYAADHDTAFVTAIRRALDSITLEENRRQTLSLASNLAQRNDPADIARGQAFYVRIAPVGAGDTFVGAELVAQWYARNIRIFANLQRIAEPGDRIVMFFGSGHAAILRDLIRADPRLRLVEARGYLTPQASAGP